MAVKGRAVQRRTGDAMRLLGRLWRRLMRQAANAMRLLGRLMRWLMRAADEGG